MSHFITDTPALDYISISTFSTIGFDRIVLGFIDDAQDKKDSSRMQYHGNTLTFEDGHIFWGSGLQKGVNHFLIQVSGAAAQRMGIFLLANGTGGSKITRLDIQVTCQLPEWFKSRSLVDSLRLDSWNGRRRKITSIDNYGNDTVYVGSRMSDNFCRIYVKEMDFLRFEMEYKAERAAACWELITKHNPSKTMVGILHAELIRMPQHPVIQMFRGILGDSSGILPVVVKPLSKRFRWFIRQCVPAILSLLNDHTCGERTRDILLDLANGEWNE